jgi:hypothetical protein
MCINNYLKAIPRYKFSILDTCHPDTLCFVSKDVSVCGYFLKPKGPVSRNVWESVLQRQVEKPKGVNWGG